MNNKRKILIIFSIFLISLFIIGVSYAFFSAIIKGNDIAKENVFTSGTMELTFTDNDDAISLPHANPGDSDSKTFIVENTGTLDDTYTYNIKLTDLYVTFKEKDLTYMLQEYTDNTFKTVKEVGTKATGFINEELINENNEMYLAVNITRPEKGKKHYYKLTITFEELDEPQDYNQGAEFRGKINVDGEAGAKLYVPPKLFSEVIVADGKNIIEDGANRKLEDGSEQADNNLRYVGTSEEVNNYIWFNCLRYDNLTNENAEDDQHKCEKWRIIGLFNNVEKVNADGSTTKENLVKIIRADSIGNINWDDNNSNDWTNASLHKSLNGDYLNPNDSGIYTNVSAIRAINATTLGMIESVKWHLGGASSVSMTTSEYYTAERGTETYQNSRPTIWPAKVGLIYSSDYGYATSGGGTTRDVCLTTKMDSWGTSPYNIDCAANSWLKPSSGTLWTLTSHSVSSTHVFYVASGGIMFNDYAGLVSLVYPSLYLKSNVKVLDDKISDGSIDKPYILVP